MTEAAVTATRTCTTSPPSPRYSGGRLVAGLVAVTVSLLPFLRPAGPGNTAAADLFMGAAIVAALLWVTYERLPVSLPYAVGVAGLVLGGALAATVNGAAPGVVLVLLQDVLLLAWAVTLALGRHDRRVTAAAVGAWSWTAPVYSGVMVGAYLLGLDAVSGVSAVDGVRASYTFGDPNLAASYLVMSLLVMAAARRPRSPALRRLGYALVLTAIFFTGSNGALLTLLVVGAVVGGVGLYRFGGGGAAGLARLGVTAVLGLVLVGVVPQHVDLDGIRAEAVGSVPLLRDSVGRTTSSTSARSTIVEEGFALFLRGDAVGYGPGQTKEALRATQAPYVKEAHNDYLATLVERGIVGGLGLLALAGAVALRCLRLGTGRLPDAYASIVPRAWLLAVGAPVMAVSAGLYEVLHFRHLWTWLGIVAALVLVMQDRERRSP